MAGSPFAGGANPIAVAIDETVRFLYLANTGSSHISGYTINATSGVLTAVSGSPFAIGTSPFGATVAGSNP